jgi:hypothetical protein
MAIIAVVIGVIIAIKAMDTGADQEVLMIGASMVIGGVVTLFSLGMACVLLDIMFNVRKISENRNSDQYTGGNNLHRAEPELG